VACPSGRVLPGQRDSLLYDACNFALYMRKTVTVV
jgi:hypothetical protein